MLLIVLCSGTLKPWVRKMPTFWWLQLTRHFITCQSEHQRNTVVFFLSPLCQCSCISPTHFLLYPTILFSISCFFSPSRLSLSLFSFSSFFFHQLRFLMLSHPFPSPCLSTQSFLNLYRYSLVVPLFEELYLVDVTFWRTRKITLPALGCAPSQCSVSHFVSCCVKGGTWDCT